MAAIGIFSPNLAPSPWFNQSEKCYCIYSNNYWHQKTWGEKLRFIVSISSTPPYWC